MAVRLALVLSPLNCLTTWYDFFCSAAAMS